MNDLERFTEWLSYGPSWDLIALALATDYLNGLEVSDLYIVSKTVSTPKIVLGSFQTEANGYSADLAKMEHPWTSENKWSADLKHCVFPLRDKGIIIGSVNLAFSVAIEDTKKVEASTTIANYCTSISLFLSFHQKLEQLNVNSDQSITFSGESEVGRLSQRQILILHGMVEGKTNHELAMELGFSVSTIRHETMRIYQALGVSDRKEAAKKALNLSLV